MCYEIQAKLLSMLKRAKRKNDDAFIQEVLEKLERFNGKPMFHLSGFDHPELLIYTDAAPDKPTVSRWGLIPPWVRNQEERMRIENSTLNARGETIFDKTSFKESALNKRCIICVDGFFEYHHHRGKTFPYFIAREDGEPLSLGGLWSEWSDADSGEKLNSFSIVTTKANSLMTEIHNNPKLAGPRMPLILSKQAESDWLSLTKSEEEVEKIKKLIVPFDDQGLTAHTVGRLKGKKSVGNCESITDEVVYAELLGDPPTLF